MLKASLRDTALTHSLLEQRHEFAMSTRDSAQITEFNSIGWIEDRAASVKRPTAKFSNANAVCSPVA
jgi:hypothetical protein